MANWWESADSWRELEEADEGFTEWAHAYQKEHGFFPGGGQDESLAQAISNREWSRGVAAERGSGPTQQEWVSHYYRPDEQGDTGQYWPMAVDIINRAFPETGAKTSNKPGFNDIAAQIQYDLMSPYWEQMARFGAARAKFDAASGAPTTDYDELVTSMAAERGIDPALARAILYWESGGNPDLRGADGEVGLMQVIPSDMSGTYKWAASRPSVADMATPEAQIKAGLDVLEAALASANGNVEEALSYYNSGGPLANAPNSTRSVYIPGVMSLYQQMRGAQPTSSRGSGGVAPQVSYHEPNPDYAYMMREDAGQPTPPVQPPPETPPPGPTHRQVVTNDPTQQTLAAIINALIAAYPQAAGEEAMRRWQAGADVVNRGADRVNRLLERQPRPAPDDAPLGEPGVFESEYRSAITDLAMPQKPGPVSFTDALNAMNQAPDTARRDVPGVVWERLYLNPNATEAQRQAALRNLGLRNESDFQLYMIGQNRPEVQAAKQLALDMWERDESDVDLPTQNIFVTPEAAEGATKVLSAAAAIVPEMVIQPTAFAVAEIGKAIASSIAGVPKIGRWVQDLAASAAGALPQVTMPTLGDAGRAAVTALAQGGYLPEQILGFLSIAQMNKEQLQRWSDGEALRQAVLDLRAAGLDGTPEYQRALYRWQQWEASEKARYEAALGVDVSGVPGIQQLETFVGGFYSPEELANATTAPPTLEQARQVVVDPAKRAAAWEAARAGYWTSPGLVALTYQQLLGLPMDDWEEAIQKAATYQNLGNEMLGQIPFDFYNLRVFEAPGRALYNRFMNRGKNYWIADVSKTADDALDDIVRANQKRSIISTIMPGATVDARRAEMLNKLSVSMQMATSGAETADDYVRLLAGYTADPVGFLNKRGLPHSQGMLEGAAILREYAGFGSKEIRVQRYADDLAEAIQEYKTAKAAGTASKEMTERIKQLRRRLNTAKKAEPAESLAKRLDKIADEGKRIHGYAGADLREYVQEEAFAKLQKTIDGLIPESSANLLEKGLSPIMKSPYYRGFMNVLVTGHMGLNPGWFFRNMTTDSMIMMIDGYNPFRSKKAVQKFIDDLGIEPRSVSKAAPIGRQAGAGGTDIGMMKPQSELERYNGEKIFAESAGNTIRPLNLQGVDSVFLKNAPKGTFTPNQEAYIRRIGEQALSERKFRNDFARLFDGTATVDDVLGPPTWKQAYGLNVEDEVKKLAEATDDAARAAIRKAQDETLDKYVEKHPLTDHPRVDSEEAARIAQRQRVAPDTVDPAEMPAGQADAIDRRLAEMAADDLDETIDVSKQEMIWRSRVHAPRFAPYTEAKGKVLAAIRSFTDEEDLAKAAGAHEVWGEMVVAQKAAKERFAHAAELFEEANEAFALAGKRTGKVKGLFRHADNAWAKAARQSTEELSEAYNKFTDFYNGATGKKWVGPVAPKGPSGAGSKATASTPKATTGTQTVAERLAAQEAEELASFEAALRANPDLSSATEDQIQRLLNEYKTGSVETQDALREQLGTPKAAAAPKAETPAPEAPPQVARAEDVVEPPASQVARAAEVVGASPQITTPEAAKAVAPRPKRPRVEQPDRPFARFLNDVSGIENDPSSWVTKVVGGEEVTLITPKAQNRIIQRAIRAFDEGHISQRELYNLVDDFYRPAERYGAPLYHPQDVVEYYRGRYKPSGVPAARPMTQEEIEAALAEITLPAPKGVAGAVADETGAVAPLTRDEWSDLSAELSKEASQARRRAGKTPDSPEVAGIKAQIREVEGRAKAGGWSSERRNAIAQLKRDLSEAVSNERVETLSVLRTRYASYRASNYTLGLDEYTRELADAVAASARKEGKAIPPEVLADYPDLAKRSGVAGAIADETGSLDLTSIKGQAEHTKRFLDDVAERLKGRPGLSKVEPLSDAAKKHLRENYKEWVRVLNKNRLVAANYGEHARHFAMHNYDGKKSADQLASLTLMYPFWSTRTYAKLPLRMAMHPGLVAKYLRYKRWLREENKDLPEWYRDKIVIDNTKIPWLPEELIFDLESSINPYNTLNREPFERPRQLEGEGMDLYLGRYMNFVEKWRFNPHFAIVAAYSASKAADGDKEAARAAMGYPAPFLRTIRDVTAWMGLNNGWGLELVPWFWTHGLFTGGDPYAIDRIAGQIGKLALSGAITPLEAREAGIAFARGESDNPVIRKALEAESNQRGIFNILGFFTSFSVKGRSGYDRQVSEARAEEAALYANAANMTDDEFLRALREFYGNPNNYHLRIASMARSELDKAETDYIRDIWWNSIPAGQTDVAIAKYGDEQLERIIDVVLRGDGIGALTEEERTRVNMFMAGLSAKYPPPNQEMFEEWRAAKDAWEAMEAAAEEKFGDGTPTISAAEALNMMRAGRGQPPQSEFSRIMEAYWEADPATRKAMREQYPVIDQYYDWREEYMENDPLLMWYYGDVPRKQATDNLWNLYNAYTDSGMAQTKVDLAQELDAMGADMGIPGCALDEEGEGCFTRYFRNQDTKDYEKIPNELLLAWTLYVASESAKRGLDPNVYRTQEGEAPGTQVLAPEPGGGDPAVVTSPWQMGESEPTRTGLPGTEYERQYGSGAGLAVPADVPGQAPSAVPPNRPGLAAPGVDVAPATPGQGPGGSDGKPVAAGDGGAELGTPSASTGEKSFWDFDFTEEQFERAAPEMDALRSERNRLYKLCDEGVEEACNQLKEDRFNVFSTPEWRFYYEQIAPGWRTQDSGFYDDPLIKQWLDPTTREGVTAESALKRMQELKNALPGLSYGDPKEYSQARDEQEQWKEISQSLMPGTMAYRQAQASFADEHPVWAKYYLRPQTAASLAEYAARGWTYAPGGGGGRSSSGGGTSGGSGYRYSGPWFSPDTFRGANTSRRPAVQDSDLWQRVVMAALSRTKQ